jgi:hypothetical protein
MAKNEIKIVLCEDCPRTISIFKTSYQREESEYIRRKYQRYPLHNSYFRESNVFLKTKRSEFLQISV